MSGPAQPVEVTTLDRWRGDGGARPGVIKIDVEGAELDVLKGAVEALRRHRPRLIIETHMGPGSGPGLAASSGRLVEFLRAAGSALARLAGQSPPPGRVATLHLLASPG